MHSYMARWTGSSWKQDSEECALSSREPCELQPWLSKSFLEPYLGRIHEFCFVKATTMVQIHIS